MNRGNGALLEQVINFASQRHKLLLDDIANVDTPNYKQKDLSLDRFNALLGERIDDRRRSGSANFDDINLSTDYPTRGILFYDRNNRSMENLATDLAKNAMMHNLAIELLRKQFQQMDMALKEKVV